MKKKPRLTQGKRRYVKLYKGFSDSFFSVISFKAWRTWWLGTRHKDSVILVHMEMPNGSIRTFLQSPDEDNTFSYKKRRFIVDDDPEMKAYNIDNDVFQLWYHFNFSLPIRIRIPVSRLKAGFSQNEPRQVRLNTNPETLERTLESNLAAGVVSGELLSSFMRRVLFMLFITMIGVVITVIIVSYASGIFESAIGMVNPS